jgi:hypothetical protein
MVAGFEQEKKECEERGGSFSYNLECITDIEPYEETPNIYDCE